MYVHCKLFNPALVLFKALPHEVKKCHNICDLVGHIEIGEEPMIVFKNLFFLVYIPNFLYNLSGVWEVAQLSTDGAMLLKMSVEVIQYLLSTAPQSTHFPPTVSSDIL